MENSIFIIFMLMCLSGFCGRAGGAAKSGKWYDFMVESITRDVGCSAIFIIACWIFLGWHPWAYLAVFLLMWGALSTYWKHLFGEINMWFSGFVVGLAALPLLIISINLLWILLARCVFLMLCYGSLNKYLPAKVILWRRDVAEEFLRYSITL